ncbi:MAG: TetR/AcrR family transcriptional regulator [Alphaproteobacteria bacterium]|nr:TetR/AcrR family transcriptional regulator [Alphaproteobacteria bacterium]
MFTHKRNWVRATGVKQKIDRMAIQLFAARGVDGVSIAEIALAAGVSQGALYRHYSSKDTLAEELFATAYRQAGADLAAIAAARHRFGDRIAAMVAHFCALYDRDPGLFRFLLLSQHRFLPAAGLHDPAPPAVIAAAVADAVAAGEVAAVNPMTATAAILGVVLQTAVFHIYGRIAGALTPRAPALAKAALAAVAALAGG